MQVTHSNCEFLRIAATSCQRQHFTVVLGIDASAVIKTLAKSNLGRKGFISSDGCSPSLRKLKAGTEAEAVEEH